MGACVWAGTSRAINGVPTPTLTLQLSHQCNELANGEDDVLSRQERIQEAQPSLTKPAIADKPRNAGL